MKFEKLVDEKWKLFNEIQEKLNALKGQLKEFDANLNERIQMKSNLDFVRNHINEIKFPYPKTINFSYSHPEEIKLFFPAGEETDYYLRCAERLDDFLTPIAEIEKFLNSSNENEKKEILNKRHNRLVNSGEADKDFCYMSAEEVIDESEGAKNEKV